MAAQADPAEFTIQLVQRADYRFEARFDDSSIPPLQTDEPPPLGSGSGPNPARLLGVAVANCLAASLLFSLRKFGNRPGPMHASATVSLVRNEANRLRIGRVKADLHVGSMAGDLKMLGRALAQFEDFCVVTQSVRAGIAVDVRVFDASGAALAPRAAEPAAAPG